MSLFTNLFQYPLCRIVGVNQNRENLEHVPVNLSVSALSDRWCEPGKTVPYSMLLRFQYPLCRIVGVNSMMYCVRGAIAKLSVSALSDRWCEPAGFSRRGFSRRLSVSALSDRWCEPYDGLHPAGNPAGLSVSALSDRWCELKSDHAPEPEPTGFQYPLCRIVGVNRNDPDAMIATFHPFSIRSVGSLV